jgi:DNA repair protein RadD
MLTARNFFSTAQDTFVPRDYQVEMINAVTSIIEGAKHKRILGVAPTGSGKSLMIAMLCFWYLEKNRAGRILVLCHQGHLLTQNEQTLNTLSQTITTGVFCNGEGRKDRDEQVIFASRDSLVRNPKACGIFDGIIVDEAHLVGNKADESYRKIFAIHEDETQFIVGFTGTPWRLGLGEIWDQKKSFFDVKAYDIKMRKLIDDGYLSEYNFPKIDPIIDTSKVTTQSTGDFNIRELTIASNKVVESCVKKWSELALGRRSSLFFCCSRDHAHEVTKLLKDKYLRPDEVCYIDGDVIGTDRAELLSDIKATKYKAIVNVGVLTTGFDAPAIDCIVMLRATKSAALFVQCIGRGLRTSPEKKDCLVLDMAGNFIRFGSLEDPTVVKPGKKKPAGGGATVKICDHCGKECESRTQCEHCGNLFISHSDQPYRGSKRHLSTVPKITPQADDSDKHDIENVIVKHDQRTKTGKISTIVTYVTKDGKVFKEWLFPCSLKSWVREASAVKLQELESKSVSSISVIKTHNPRFPKILPHFSL